MNSVSWLEGIGTPAFRDGLAARAPQLAVWVLALALGVQAALIVTRLAGAGHPAATAAPPAMAAARRALDITALANAHLFGQAPLRPTGDDANAPQTNMPLVLTGVVAGATPKDGLAILGPSATATKLYPVGAHVSSDAVVHAVYQDRVLLERNGAIEALLLPTKFGGKPMAGPSPGDRLQRAIENQPSLLSDVIRPQPVFVDGHQRGYRVYPGRNPRAFASLGLRNGDLVTAINGQPLDDPNRSTDVFRTLGSADQAHVTVMRNGAQQELTLDMSQLANQADQMSSASQGNTDATSTGQDGAPQPAPAPAPVTPAAPTPATVPPSHTARDNK